MNKTWIIIIVILVGLLAAFLLLPAQDTGDEIDDLSLEAGAMIATVGKAFRALPEGAQETYQVDATQSSVSWAAERIVGGAHSGTVTVSEGTVTMDNQLLVGGTFTIDFTTITEDAGNEQVVEHLSSADFFEVDVFPVGMFQITNVEREAEGGDLDGSYQVTGDLTIKGITNEVSFPITVETAESGDSVRAQGELTIDRTLWGITFDSGSVFDDIGDRAIRDEVELGIDVVLNQVAFVPPPAAMTDEKAEGEAMEEDKMEDKMEDTKEVVEQQ